MCEPPEIDFALYSHRKHSVTFLIYRSFLWLATIKPDSLLIDSGTRIKTGGLRSLQSAGVFMHARINYYLLIFYRHIDDPGIPRVTQIIRLDSYFIFALFKPYRYAHFSQRLVSLEGSEFFPI